MIIEEILTNNLVKHYSDNGKYILQNETGIEYAEAVDVLPCRYTYSETQKNIEIDINQLVSGVGRVKNLVKRNDGGNEKCQ